jgi:hypothetical protein
MSLSSPVDSTSGESRHLSRRVFGRRSVRAVDIIALMAGLATASAGCTSAADPSDVMLGASWSPRGLLAQGRQ